MRFELILDEQRVEVGVNIGVPHAEIDAAGVEPSQQEIGRAIAGGVAGEREVRRPQEDLLELQV